VDGFLVIDKPVGISSREAVDRVQAWLPEGTRVGHTGTLDPLASGVLVLAIGLGTRLTEYVQEQAKVYRAEVTFGAFTSTDDAEGTPTPVPDGVIPDRAVLEKALAGFLGHIEQVPPAFSAAHVKGRRAYRLARKGKPVELEPRTVRVDRIDIHGYAHPRLDLEIECGKGTYIRSLARDLGRRLGCGGYLSALRRLRVGVFDERDALSLDPPPVSLTPHLRPLADAVAHIPNVRLDDDRITRLAHGQTVPITELDTPSTEVAVLDSRGQLRAIARREPDGPRLRPIRVLPAS
jgi:tRNA pseudouridine55 synthase